MSFSFKPAKREGVHVILGLSGGTGSGKTWSALELATGLAGGQPFAVIDTEAGRALQYADYFDFQHGDLKPPFSPSAYLEAIVAAEKAGYPVAVLDSMSHEHAGDGGILDMHEAELGRIAGKDHKKRERVKFLAWVKPKSEHKRMVARLLQMRMHLILCFRAEPKMKIVKVVKNGRQVSEPVDVGWQPICAKGLEYEMAASFMLNNEKPGSFVIGETAQMADEAGLGVALKIPEPLREIFTGTGTFDRGHGEAVAKWAAGDGAVAGSAAPGEPIKGEVVEDADPESINGDPRPVSQMLKEDYMEIDGGMSRETVASVLRAAGLMVKGKSALPKDVDREAVRKALDAAFEVAGGPG